MYIQTHFCLLYEIIQIVNKVFYFNNNKKKKLRKPAFARVYFWFVTKRRVCYLYSIVSKSYSVDDSRGRKIIITIIIIRIEQNVLSTRIRIAREPSEICENRENNNIVSVWLPSRATRTVRYQYYITYYRLLRRRRSGRRLITFTRRPLCGATCGIVTPFSRSLRHFMTCFSRFPRHDRLKWLPNATRSAVKTR